MNRREVLWAFLGVPLATGACKSPRSSAAIGGALVDTLLATGHLLRAAPPPLAQHVTRTVDCLVVGGGAAGLSAAWRLRGAGLDDVLVVELDSELGGTSKSGRNAVSAYPWGAHYLPAPLSAQGPVPRLLKEAGLLTGTRDDGAPQWAEQVLIHEPEERLFYRGHWYEGLYPRAAATPEDLAQLKRFEASTAALARAVDSKGRKAFAVPVATGSDDAEFTALDRISMRQWMDALGFTSERLRWYVDYACRDDYGTTAEHVSAWAGLWYFAARRGGAEDAAGYLSWPEGNGHLIGQLGRALSPKQVSTSTLVHTLSPAPEGSDWVADALEGPGRTPVKLRARQVVLAAPRFVAARVLAPWRGAGRPAFVDDFVTSPWVVANVTVKQRPHSRGFPLAWDNVLYGSKSLGYVVATHQRERGDPTGPTVLTWYYPLAGEDPVAERKRLLETTWADWRDLVLADLSPAHPGFAESVTHIDVMRWGHAMVRPRPGFVWGGARAAAAQSLGTSLHFAHTELSGLALFEEANWHGVRAAEQVLAGLGRSGDVSWL